MTRLTPLEAAAPAAIEALLDAAFGTDRHQRTAYRLRDGISWLPALSLAAWDEGTLVGTLQSWPVALDDTTPLVLVGPVAVIPARQQEGIGRLMTETILARADADPAIPPQVLIGDPEYYARFFGFAADATAGWTLPGPWERRRLLARTGGRTLPETGMLGPRP